MARRALDACVVIGAVLVGCATGETVDDPTGFDAAGSDGGSPGAGGEGATGAGGSAGSGGLGSGAVGGSGGATGAGGATGNGGAVGTGGLAVDDGGAGSPGSGGASSGGVSGASGGASGAGGAPASGGSSAGGASAGGQAGAGGACATATNQDTDGRTDCEEDADGILSTSKYVFNGMTASLVGSGGGNCTEIARATQITSLFATPIETHAVHSGWEFDTDQPESQSPNSPTFGFQPPFTSTVTGWRMLYRGLFWVPPSAVGQYCFNVDIGSDGGSGTDDDSPDACGAIFLPDVQANAWVMNGRHQSSTSDSPPMPSESNQRTKCTTFDTAGPRRIDFVYQYSGNNADNRHQLHVRYCHGGAAACTPGTLIDDAVLTPVNQVIPTCTDGLQNGGETGVDCGGPDCSGC